MKKAPSGDVPGELADALRRYKADIFSVLANPTRIHIIELLRDGELSVGALTERLGVEPANASQHLAILRNKRLVEKRKEGNQAFYSLRDPMLIEVLGIMRGYFQSHLSEAMEMLREMEAQG